MDVIYFPRQMVIASLIETVAVFLGRDWARLVFAWRALAWFAPRAVRVVAVFTADVWHVLRLLFSEDYRRTYLKARATATAKARAKK